MSFRFSVLQRMGGNLPFSQKNEFAWTKLISEHTKHGQGREAVWLYKKMRVEGIIPNNYTFVAALKACSSIAQLEEGKTIHAHALESGHHTDIFVSSTLIDMYAKCGSIDEARAVFEKMRHRNVVSWNAMIIGYAHMEMGVAALQLYTRMRHEGIKPDSRTFVATLMALSSMAAQDEGNGVDGEVMKTSCLEQGRIMHAELARRGFEADIFVANTLVDMYAKCKSMDEARQFFEQMRHRDVVSWTAMIVGYTHMQMGNSALELYVHMQYEGFIPDARTFVAALKACAGLAAEEDKRADNELLKASYLKQGRTIHTQLAKGVFESDIFIANTLVDMYAKCGSIEEACQVFEKMRHRDVVSWTALIMGYAQMERGVLALELYARMKHEGFTPDARTFIAALKACGSLVVQGEGRVEDELLKTSYLEQGRTIHVELVKRGFESDIFVANTLVDMYAKLGSIKDARRVFEKMSHRDVVSWNAMIAGYLQMEMGDLALKLYRRMQQEGFRPNAHTYAAALKACGNLASLSTGKGIHSQIRGVGLEDQSYIASCLVDMYCKCGSMVDAQQFFDSLCVRDSFIWGALIAGYSGQGHSESVFASYKRMQKEGIKPDDVTFMSVLSVCSHNCLVDKGQMYFQAMFLEFCMSPSSKHYMCMVNLFGNAGKLDDAMAMVKKMPFQPDEVTWMSILGSCQKWNNVETGRNAFECAVMLDKKLAAAYVAMINVYVAARMWEESAEIQERRVKARAWKKEGYCRWTDGAGVVHTFYEGVINHCQSNEIYEKLRDLFCKMKEEGYIADSDIVSYQISNYEKTLVYAHSEKQAVACALINTPPGTPIRFVKNFQICVDCHNFSSFISKIEQCTIICRDASRFHVFKDGKCSCANF